MLHERHFAASLGRFRVSFTSDPAALAAPLPHELEAALAARRHRPERRSTELKRVFAGLAPELDEGPERNRRGP